MIDLKQAEQQIRRLEADRDRAAETLAVEQAAVAELNTLLVSIDEARTISQSIAEELQRRAHDKIASVVTRCLAAVFDDPYEFVIRFERKRNKTEAVLEFRRDGRAYSDPMNEVGGGVLDVASLALRISCLMIGKPQPRRLLLLDEPFNNIRGEGNRTRTAKLLGVLAEEFGVQIVLNTDIPSYRMGGVLELGQGD